MPLEMDARLRGLRRWVRDWSLVAILRAVLVVLLLVQVARLAWALVSPIGPLGDWRPAAPMAREAAAGVLAGFDPFFRLDRPAAPAAGVVTNLQLALFGTRLDDATGRGSAIIATPDGVQKSYAVGDEIVPGVKLKEVAFDHVTLDRGGAAEDLFIDQSGAAAGQAPAPAAPATDSSLAPPPADDAPRNSDDDGVSLAELRQGIGFIPRIDGGRVTGLAVRPQGGGGLFSRLGFHSGDVVTQVNGHPVNGAQDLQSAAAGLADGGNLSVSVERGAEVLPLVIRVKGQ